MITEIFVIVKGFYLIQLFFLLFDAYWSHVLNCTFNWHSGRHSKSYWIFKLVRLATEKTSFQYLLKLSQNKSTFCITFWNFDGLVYFLTFKIFITARSSHQRYSIGVLEFSQNSQENAGTRMSFLIKLQASGLFYRTFFLQNTSGRLHLYRKFPTLTR